jgi:excisionase family DNA binding protein
MACSKPGGVSSCSSSSSTAAQSTRPPSERNSLHTTGPCRDYERRTSTTVCRHSWWLHQDHRASNASSKLFDQYQERTRANYGSWSRLQGGSTMTQAGSADECGSSLGVACGEPGPFAGRASRETRELDVRALQAKEIAVAVPSNAVEEAAGEDGSGPAAAAFLGSGRALLRVEEAAAWLGLGRTKTYELVARGALRSVCIGRSRRVPVSALVQFLERLTIDGAI